MKSTAIKPETIYTDATLMEVYRENMLDEIIKFLKKKPQRRSPEEERYVFTREDVNLIMDKLIEMDVDHKIYIEAQKDKNGETWCYIMSRFPIKAS